jgi:membrane protein YdbS with pleckstrin-like domain
MRLFIGLILIAVGVFALLVQLDVLSGSLWSYVWPSIIIALGLSFLLGIRRRWRYWCWRGEDRERKD